MINPPLAILYLALCLLLGYCGRDKRFGFTGNFLAAVLFTPLLGFLFYLFQTDIVRLPKGK